MDVIANPDALLVLAAGAYVGAMLVALFVWLERQGRSEVAVGVVAGALVAQLTFYAVDSRVPVGPFRPGPLRLPELLIGAALLARVWVRPTYRNLSDTGLAWLAFAAWTATGAVIGFLNGNEVDSVLFHGKVAFYVGGGYLLAAGVPAGRLVSRRAIGGWVVGLGALVAVQAVFTATYARVLGPLTPAGIGADAASFYLGAGILVLLLQAAQRPGRVWLVVAAAPMVVAPLVTGQRASVVHLAVTVVVLVLVMAGRTWRRRMVVRPTQLVLGAAVVLAVLSLAALPGLTRGEVVPEQVSATADQTFGGVGNTLSADARVQKWDAGWRMVAERPLLGWGLGATHRYFRPGVRGTGEFTEGTTFDNVVFDLLVRSGIPGLLLFSVAVALSMRDAWNVWLRHTDPRVAALGLAVLVFVTGLMAKGVVESVLEKVVLACALGLMVGAVASARAEHEAADQLPVATVPRRV